MRSSIAIVSLSCRFADAASPSALWANVLEGRRSFRAIPRTRLDLSKYSEATTGAADSITPIRGAGLLTDWSFDRTRFMIPQKTFEATDLTHWLALELANDAIAELGGPQRLDRCQTAVIVANTLTGEFSRAGLLRLRAPFLDEVLARAGEAEGVSGELMLRLRRQFAADLRRSFPEPNEDSLAGGLANTIAGRIANHFDFRGGAYSIDGACASSLVGLADGAAMLRSGQTDCVVVGAVDLSLDPFELVGFSRNGALATNDMSVFDERANGFLPGEGGAFAVLMREDDALRMSLPVLALIRGWGLSSDGAGGLTRPSSEGQLIAYRRAYDMASVDPADLAFVEAHGTGTAVGDPTEVRALATLRQQSRSALPIGSIKGNIGHTKAAAGFAGLIKTVEALRYGVVGPHAGCERPHPIFDEVDGRVRVVFAPEPICNQSAAIAGVSSFGFGGINAHLVVERPSRTRPPPVALHPILTQHTEMFLFSAATAAGVASKLRSIQKRASTFSNAEMMDAAAALCAAAGQGPWRACILADRPEELIERLEVSAQALERGETLLQPENGMIVAPVQGTPRIGFLFPGQAAPVRPAGGRWAKRFPSLAATLESIAALEGEPPDTRIAQPVIVGGSLAALNILHACGVEAIRAAGHSLGEISALAWVGVLTPSDALSLACLRGEVMSKHGLTGGCMLRLELAAGDARNFILGSAVVVACENGPLETVVAGPSGSIDALARRAAAAGIGAVRLPVSHAFHTRMMRDVVPPFAQDLEAFTFQPPKRRLISTITGQELGAHECVRNLLLQQIEQPVKFLSALETLSRDCDLVIEVGPGTALSRLAREVGLLATSVDAYAESLAPLLGALGLAYCSGATVNTLPLFRDRHTRPIDLEKTPSFLASPCGATAPAISVVGTPTSPNMSYERSSRVPNEQAEDSLRVVSTLVAELTGLAADNIRPDLKFLSDLHLNSLAVARLVAAAAKRCKIASPRFPTEFADATLAELAEALDELTRHGDTARRVISGVGVRPWLRTYGFRFVPSGPALPALSKIHWLPYTEVPQGLCHANQRDETSQHGAIVWLGKAVDIDGAEALWRACQAAWHDAAIRHLAICHSGAPIASFARSLSAEGRFSSVRVIECAADTDSSDIVIELSAAASTYHEVRLQRGRRWKPIFAPVEAKRGSGGRVGPQDVVLVTGGARGISAECALDLARRTDASLILCGRSPLNHPEVMATLARAAEHDVRCHYLQADVCRREELADALAEPAIAALGKITVLIHSAALNEPCRFDGITPEAMRRTLMPKSVGLENAVNAAGTAVRKIVTFGSIIGRLGLEGETHYALANACQSSLCEEIACRTGIDALAIEWSVWGGTGMGERLGTLERLAAEGVEAISVDDALNAFDHLISANAVGAVVVTSRFGQRKDVDLASPALPPLRFVDDPVVFYPGVELVSETSVSLGRDAYLSDHRLDGEIIFPGVFGLEAMAQVASVLGGRTDVSRVHNVAFARMISFPADRALRLQIAALRHPSGAVEATIRASDDHFSAVRMRATYLFGERQSLPARTPLALGNASVATDRLYDSFFFSSGRFKRVMRFDSIASRHAAFRLENSDAQPCFGPFEPQTLLLVNPEARDGALHGLQVCVPHRRVLPIAVERIVFGRGKSPAYVVANEKETAHDTFRFDICIFDEEGDVVEHWVDVTFKGVSDIDIEAAVVAAPALAGPYIERIARAALLDESLTADLVIDATAPREIRRAIALERLGLQATLSRRSDGKLTTVGPNATEVSLAHTEDATLAVAAQSKIGCDLTRVADFPDGETGAIDWVRTECMRKLSIRWRSAPTPASVEIVLPLGTPQRPSRIAVSIALADVGSTASMQVAAIDPDAASETFA